MFSLLNNRAPAVALAALMLLPAAVSYSAHADTAPVSPASPEPPALQGNPGGEPALPGNPQAPDNPAKGQTDPSSADGALDLGPMQKEKNQATPYNQEQPQKPPQEPSSKP
ncbi:hypothetical protein [Pseudomonas typographi]|uniref:Lipoprotein n=1 Tax=Pseudomonas typographi TaxID=2715964 RepID=A0ABR7Z296_9PSED|nr:hypothetical protein [Pseudomonas typographi]MBD1552332.1 hypothetical protein [Pseudomonas typographi]MBD1587273.1 hypothetical protein [Pseudomonas typographi]MBD1599590.1 hypothetical protein [Pseudomonas typographi]